MLRLAARYADTWNTLGRAEQLEEISRRNERVDEYCRALGRDPRSLRRSFLLFYPDVGRQQGPFNYYESVDAFTERIQTLLDMGMTDILLAYPYREEQRLVFEKIARDVIPALKEQYIK
jgi:alkanesulfonate monooxygenase SsuD/methylene tetrahydromethanopterin reductase-like flavin-dependent oxidoreductase (luciferase family)